MRCKVMAKATKDATSFRSARSEFSPSLLESDHMRVMLITKTIGVLGDSENEAGIMPSPDITANVRKMIGEMVQAGAFLVGEGLQASSLGVRVRFAAGQRTVTKGPLTGRNELTAGLCIVRCNTIDDAVEWASRFAAIIGDCEFDIRPPIEPWDVGWGAKPAEQRFTRYMLVLKGNAAYEAGKLPDAGQRAAIAQVIDAMKAANVYQVAELLKPSRHARRIIFQSGKARATDGPFAESKELIAGYLLLNLPSVDAVAAWAPTYAKAIGDAEFDIRPLYEPAELQ